MDKGDDGIAVSATHLTTGQQLAGDYEKVCVGTVKFGMRSTQVSEKFAMKCTSLQNTPWCTPGMSLLCRGHCWHPFPVWAKHLVRRLSELSQLLLAQVSSDFNTTIQSWTSSITSLLAPAGPGYFHYCSVQGRPVLLGMRLGQLSAEHFAAEFLQQHAPGRAALPRQCRSNLLPGSLFLEAAKESAAVWWCLLRQ